VIDVEDVRAAAERIGGRIRRTPVLPASDSTWFKLEYTQHAGSFKTRGMLNQILSAPSVPATAPSASNCSNRSRAVSTPYWWRSVAAA
jgi:threonine dehydratase